MFLSRHWIQFLFRLGSARTSKFEGDPRFSPWGRPVHTQLLSAFLSRKNTGNHLQQVSPFKLVGIHLLLKYCLIWIGRLRVKIVESFQFECWPGVMSARLLVYGRSFRTNIWLLAHNMSSCSSSKFPLVEILMLGSLVLTPLNVFH